MASNCTLNQPVSNPSPMDDHAAALHLIAAINANRNATYKVDGCSVPLFGNAFNRVEIWLDGERIAHHTFTDYNLLDDCCYQLAGIQASHMMPCKGGK